jgi:hypothetical protein
LLRGRLLAIFAVLSLFAVLPASADARSFGSRTLKQGSRGHDVRVLQDYLTRAGFRTAVDGRFGPGTKRRVRSWERSAGRRVDGRVTKRDARALRRVVERGEEARTKSQPVMETVAAEPAVDPAASGGAAFVQVSRATLNPDGTATAPPDAPQAVKDIIAYGNEIAFKPYKYGGGHGKWYDSGYDCSGSISYPLHFAGLLDRALDSTGFESYGAAGPGTWVTIYANAGHAYMVVAGLRFDTSAAKAQANGSRWTAKMRSADGFVVRHPVGL